MWDSSKNAWVAQENQGNIVYSRNDIEIKFHCVKIQLMYLLFIIGSQNATSTATERLGAYVTAQGKEMLRLELEKQKEADRKCQGEAGSIFGRQNLALVAYNFINNL